MDTKKKTLTIKCHSQHGEDEVQQPREHRDMTGRVWDASHCTPEKCVFLPDGRITGKAIVFWTTLGAAPIASMNRESHFSLCFQNMREQRYQNRESDILGNVNIGEESKPLSPKKPVASSTCTSF
jgi:hypothetical protein